MKIISVRRAVELARLGLKIAYRGEGDLPSIEWRSDHKTQALDPCLPRHGAEGKIHLLFLLHLHSLEAYPRTGPSLRGPSHLLANANYT